MSELSLLDRIPQEYRTLWVPFEKRDTFLYHVTTIPNWELIKSTKSLLPHDPAPRRWSGMSAVFISDPHNPQYHLSEPRVRSHVETKGTNLIRLIIHS